MYQYKRSIVVDPLMWVQCFISYCLPNTFSMGRVGALRAGDLFSFLLEDVALKRQSLEKRFQQILTHLIYCLLCSVVGIMVKVARSVKVGHRCPRDPISTAASLGKGWEKSLSIWHVANQSPSVFGPKAYLDFYSGRRTNSWLLFTLRGKNFTFRKRETSVPQFEDRLPRH
jgi:hypothetical protein